MCGTLSRSITTDKIVAALDVKHVFSDLPPSYNIKPSLPVVIVREENGERVLDVAHWWLTPQWVKKDIEFVVKEDGRKSYKWKGKPISMFNLRFDNVTNPEKPTWQKFLTRKRCAIIVDAFVEWPDDKMRDKTKDKIPGMFYYKSREPFGLLGFWETIKDDEGKDFNSCCLITVEPNEMLKALPHHRMPAMLRGEELYRWLSGSLTDPMEASKLCRTTPDEEMGGHFISKAINTGKNNYLEMLEPVGRFDEENAVVSSRLVG
jgi:putative SOS response-associated peptidase YedK